MKPVQNFVIFQNNKQARSIEKLKRVTIKQIIDFNKILNNRAVSAIP